MMINKRLIGVVSDSKKYIAGNVVIQWLSLVANIAMMTVIAFFLANILEGPVDTANVVLTFSVVVAAVIIRYICSVMAAKMSFLSSKAVKKVLREKIYRKLLSLGSSYHEKVKTSEVVQVAVEGVDQLETYFGAYLPQFFYAMLAPLTLFIYLSFVNLFAAVVLLVCVPLIPVAIAVVQTWAKKLLSKYWGRYTSLGDTFLENLQGLTTLKIYQADEQKHKEMNAEAEAFRKITMKVLTMQLNSITIMDLVAYGGNALGVIIAVTQYGGGNVSLAGCLMIILLSADFFLPMRQLGSYFHIAMNGMAASDKIFRLLDLEEPEEKGKWEFPKDRPVKMESVTFSYDGERDVLSNVSMEFPSGRFTAIVGESGCGKSTVASILMGRNKGYHGSVLIGDLTLTDICEESLMQNVTYVSHHGYLFKGNVRENLQMGKAFASDEEMWNILERVRLADFLRSENGLDTVLQENASNLSGGQCQRLVLARALLHDSPIYIFDEATSNIDVESETDIMKEIYALAERKTVILISHRLANVVSAHRIYVMNNGCIAEEGGHAELLKQGGLYRKLWDAQQVLESYTGGGSQ